MIDHNVLYTYLMFDMEYLVRCAHGCKGSAPSGAVVHIGHRNTCVSDERVTSDCWNVIGDHCNRCYHDDTALGMHDN